MFVSSLLLAPGISPKLIQFHPNNCYALNQLFKSGYSRNSTYLYELY